MRDAGNAIGFGALCKYLGPVGLDLKRERCLSCRATGLTDVRLERNNLGEAL